jgi:tetratricopeptide (TPR) repeat protein
MAASGRDRTVVRPAGDCPASEDFAAYIDGTLTAARRQSLERHVADCDDCRAILADTAASLRAADALDDFRGRSRGSRRMLSFAALAAAAVLLIVLRLAWTAGHAPAGPQPSQLPLLVAALAKAPTRPVVGRLAGDFTYAPPPSLTRGAAAGSPSPDVQIAAAAIEKQAGQDATPERRADLGVALLAVGELDRAIDELAGATSGRADAAAFNNLSVAYLTRSVTTGRRDDLQLALETADRALALQPASAAALFNRALILNALDRPADAQRAADRYLSQDPNSPWAGELRAKLRR